MLLSIVTPIHNRSAIFERTLKSVTKQLNPLSQYVIVSDGSEDLDNLRSLLDQYESPLIKFFHYPINSGTGHAVNVATDLADGEWLTFIGSDDEITTGGIDKLTNYLIPKNANKDFFYFRLQYSNGEITPSNYKDAEKLSWENYLKFINTNIGKNLDVGICVRKDVLKQVRYPTNWAYENFVQLALNKNFSGGFEPDVLYLINTDAPIRGSIANLKIGNEIQARKIFGQSQGFKNVLRIYGKDIKRNAPIYYADILRKILSREMRLLMHPNIYLKEQNLRSFITHFLQIFMFCIKYFNISLRNF